MIKLRKERKFFNFNISIMNSWIDVKIKDILLVCGKLIKNINWFYAFTQPLFFQKEAIFVYNVNLLLNLVTLPCTFYFPRFYIEHISNPFFNIWWKFLAYMPYFLVKNFLSNCYFLWFHSILFPSLLPVFYEFLKRYIVSSSCRKVYCLVFYHKIFESQY